METIPWDAVGAGSGWVVVGVMVLLLFRGKVIPGSTHAEILADKNDRLAKQEALIANLSQQNQVLLEAGIPAITEFMNGLRRASGDVT